MSQHDTPYTYATGEGFLGSYAVVNGRELRSQIGAPPLRDHLGAESDDTVGVHPHPDGVVLRSPPGDGETVTRLGVTAQGQLTLTGTVLRDHLGAGDGDRVRLYEHDDGLLAVVDRTDPRAGGDEA